MSEAARWLEFQEAREHLQNRLTKKPAYAIITGTGLSAIKDHYKTLETVPYLDIPNMPSPSVSSHQSELCLVEISGLPVLIFCGRFHHYEGRDMHEITFPVRICQGLGITNLIVTNAAGGLHSHFEPGELVIIKDHINLLPEHPLRGLTMKEWGNRFPDPKSIYNLEWRRKAHLFLKQESKTPGEGVYACVSGPALETIAELKFLKTIGADLVGMSTVPEVLVAAQCNMKVLGISVVTNIVDPEKPMQEVELQDVIDVSQAAIPRLAALIAAVL